MYSLAEAAEATGKSKSTIFRSVKSGTISASKDDAGKYHIAPSELHRVYPPVAFDAPDAVAQRVNDAPRNDEITSGDAPEMALRLAVAEKELEAANRVADDRQRTIDDLRDRLDKEGEERRKMTAMLTDQRPKGLWAWLRGK